MEGIYVAQEFKQLEQKVWVFGWAPHNEEGFIMGPRPRNSLITFSAIRSSHVRFVLSRNRSTPKHRRCGRWEGSMRASLSGPTRFMIRWSIRRWGRVHVKLLPPGSYTAAIANTGSLLTMNNSNC